MNYYSSNETYYMIHLDKSYLPIIKHIEKILHQKMKYLGQVYFSESSEQLFQHVRIPY